MLGARFVNGRSCDADAKTGRRQELPLVDKIRTASFGGRFQTGPGEEGSLLFELQQVADVTPGGPWLKCARSQAESLHRHSPSRQTRSAVTICLQPPRADVTITTGRRLLIPDGDTLNHPRCHPAESISRPLSDSQPG